MNAIPRPSSEALLSQSTAPHFQRNITGSRFGFGVGASVPDNQVSVIVSPVSAGNPVPVRNEAHSQHMEQSVAVNSVTVNPETLQPQRDQASGHPQAYSQNNHRMFFSLI